MAVSDAGCSGGFGLSRQGGKVSESLDMPFQWPLRNIDEARRMIVAVQDWAAAAGLDLRQPPEIPDSCCGRGCNGCVWEIGRAHV